VKICANHTAKPEERAGLSFIGNAGLSQKWPLIGHDRASAGTPIFQF
jgi:hypothetical protein